MGVIRHSWQGMNSRRSYPIEELSSKMADSGERFPSDILIEAKLRFADTYGSRARLDAVAATRSMVSATFSAVDVDGGNALTPLCYVTVAKPIQVGKPYAVTPYDATAGVGGWVTFGEGVNNICTYRFTQDPVSMMLVKSAAMPYRSLPVPFISKPGFIGRLRGNVLLVGVGGLVIEEGTRDYDGTGEKPCIVFHLDKKTDPEILSKYVGECGGLPESGTCDFTPISLFGGVTPDENGDVSIVFSGSTINTLTSDHAVLIELPSALSSACDDGLPAPDGTIPGSGDDECAT